MPFMPFGAGPPANPGPSRPNPDDVSGLALAEPSVFGDAIATVTGASVLAASSDGIHYATGDSAAARVYRLGVTEPSAVFVVGRVTALAFGAGMRKRNERTRQGCQLIRWTGAVVEEIPAEIGRKGD